MSRLFDGVDDKVAWSIGGLGSLTGWTFAMIYKSAVSSGWQSYGGVNVSGGTSTTAMGRSNNINQWTMMTGGGVNTQGAGNDFSTSWCLYAASRPAGTNQTVRFLKYVQGGATTFSNSGGNLSDPSSLTSGSVRFGEIDGSDFASGRLAAFGIWGTNLGDAAMQALLDTMTRAQWQSTSPIFLVDADDVFQTDYGSGGSTRTSITGTASDADDPTGWASWAGAGGSFIAQPPRNIVRPAVMRAATW